jgi:transcription elongation GreA/GreB family factor
MSRAFVKEIDSDASELLDRPLSLERNYVTEAGLAAIEAALDRSEHDYRAATGRADHQAAALALRELRYWRVRRASAEIVKIATDKGQVSFGMTVTLRREDDRIQRFRIVGEDEADPANGTVSHASPLARAVLTHGPGDRVEIAGEDAVILEID